mmetsp:Transcript_4144/g.14465  ORF Transcript_4144/g.14465 Transcript_4144/m.14465 type:complete len:243 (+) Transcript_4144:459-1187(+)
MEGDKGEHGVGVRSVPAAAEGRQGRPGADPLAGVELQPAAGTGAVAGAWGYLRRRSCARGWRLQLRAQAAQEDPRVPRGQGGPSGDLPGAALAPVVRPHAKGARRGVRRPGRHPDHLLPPRPRPPHRKVRRGGCEGTHRDQVPGLPQGRPKVRSAAAGAREGRRGVRRPHPRPGRASLVRGEGYRPHPWGEDGSASGAELWGPWGGPDREPVRSAGKGGGGERREGAAEHLPDRVVRDFKKK